MRPSEAKMRRKPGYLLRRMEQLEAYADRLPQATESQVQDFLSLLSDAELLQLQRDIQQGLVLAGPEEQAPVSEAGLVNLSAQEARELLEFLREWREDYWRTHQGTPETLRADESGSCAPRPGIR